MELILLILFTVGGLALIGMACVVFAALLFGPSRPRDE
jgi:hypothetical protein